MTTTNAIGINFADVYSDQTTINGSYFFNKTNVFNTSNSFTQNLFGTNTTTVNNSAIADADRVNHRLNFTIDTKLDSTTSIRIQPNISYTESDGRSSNIYDRNVLTTVTNGIQQYNTLSQTPSISNNLLIRKKFQRRGRSISLNVNTNINDSDAENLNQITDNIITGSSTVTRITNQLNDNKSESFSNSSRLVYTEPLSKTLSLELNFQNNYIKDNNNRQVFNFNPASQSYDLIDPIFTNDFENTTMTNSLGFSFNKTEKKYNWNIGLAVLNTDRENLNLTTGNVFNQNFYNLTPSAQYRYTFSQNKRLEVRYRGNTQQPSIAQIQPIPDNTNTQTVVLGNPTLRPSFGNNLTINYRNFNFASFRTFFALVSVNQTFNSFAKNTELITNPADVNFGKIATTFLNVAGNYNGFAVVNFGQPIVKGNKLTLNLSANLNFDRQTNFTNSIKNINNNITSGGSVRLVSNLDKLDLVGGMSVSYTNSKFSAQPTSNNSFYRLTPNIDISYLFPGNIRLQSDLYYNKVTGQGNFDTDYVILNGYISRQFFKN
ncbi:MAG: hypothetical protein EOO89_23745, partial [Pedobacter sp.]